METYEKIVDKINSLKAAIETETIKIKTLATYYNYLQVRAWRRYRQKLKSDLEYWQKRLDLYRPTIWNPSISTTAKNILPTKYST